MSTPAVELYGDLSRLRASAISFPKQQIFVIGRSSTALPPADGLFTVTGFRFEVTTDVLN